MDFQRADGTRAQSWIDDNLPVCPFCRNEPRWTIASEVDPKALTRWFFKCSSCASVISIILDEPKQARTRVGLATRLDLPTAKNIRIESAGRPEDQDFVGEEFPLYELQEWAEEG